MGKDVAKHAASSSPTPSGSSSSSSAAVVSTSALANLADTRIFVQTSLAHLKDALALLPVAAKRDFETAVTQAPELVLNESNPTAFLRTEDYNPWPAAKRLVLYWEYRKWLFGTERWLKPLVHKNNDKNNDNSNDDDDSCALTAQDLHLASTGWVAYCQPHDKDHSNNNHKPLGRFLLVDHGKYAGHALDSFLRVIFYLCTVATDATAQTVGLTSVRLVSSVDPSKGQSVEPPLSMALCQTSQTAFRMMKQALPVRLTRVVFLREASTTDSNVLHLFLQRVGKSMQESNQHGSNHQNSNKEDHHGGASATSSTSHVGSSSGNRTVLTVVVPSAAQAAETLAAWGFPKSALPDSHGGTWTYDRLFEWKTKHGGSDGTNNHQLATTSSTNTFQVPLAWLKGTVGISSPTSVASSAVATTSTTPYAAMSSAYSSATCTPLGTTTTITTTTATYAIGNTNMDRHKQVNALNARRAYQKRKLKQNETAEKAAALEQEHQQLWGEHERLQALLQQARDVLALVLPRREGGEDDTKKKQ